MVFRVVFALFYVLLPMKLFRDLQSEPDANSNLKTRSL